MAISSATQIFAELRRIPFAHSGAGVRPGLAAVLVRRKSRLVISTSRAKSRPANSSAYPARYSLRRLPSSTLDLARHRLRPSIATDATAFLFPPSAPPAGRYQAAFWKPSIPAKDVDCFIPSNLGRLVSDAPVLVACTPPAAWKFCAAMTSDRKRQRRRTRPNDHLSATAWALLLMHPMPPSRFTIRKTRDLQMSSAARYHRRRPWAKSATWKRLDQARRAVIMSAPIALRTQRCRALFRNFPDRLEKFRAKGSALVAAPPSRRRQHWPERSPVPRRRRPHDHRLLISTP